MIIRHFKGSKNITTTIPDNYKIRYTSTDGNIVIPNSNDFWSKYCK